MVLFAATEISLPAFLDPVLEMLSDRLPEPVFNLFINILAHGIALFTALLSFLGVLLRTNPFEWDAQTVLPPLITLLSAYLALITLYRTTGWIFRTVLAFIKWGLIFTALGVAGGWYIAGGANGGNGLGSLGLASSIGRFILDSLNGPQENVPGNQGSRTRTTSSRSSRTRGNQRAERPKPWESFDRHQQWRTQNAGQVQDGDDVQQVLGSMVGAAAKVVRENGWWEAAKNTVEGIVNAPSDDNAENSGRGNPRSTRSRTGRATTR
ncbi:hypothetical protein EYR40_006743 [Pleurotus pulmonarius]|nr:hypothetical protein EYR36_011364 [Pleurotus pulmonarius]KAF4599644.1 hypothetical protein EYR40_006743 [Pleurotus pulmonarius]